MPELLPLLMLVAAGVACGAINVISGGGSFFTLPILIFLGLPASVANGTNRIGVLMQSVTATWQFEQFKVLDRRWALIASVPATIGSVFGAVAALYVSDEAFRRILSLVMIVASVGAVLAPPPSAQSRDTLSSMSAPIAIAFFVIGIYGGFMQAGIGLLILVVTSWSRIDLVRGTALKSASVLVLTAVSLAIFASQSRVHWPFGMALGVGNLFGGLLGARLAVRRGHQWIKTVVTISVVALALRLWFF